MQYLSVRADRHILQAPIQFTNLFSLPGDTVSLTIACLSQLFQHGIPILKPAYIASPHELQGACMQTALIWTTPAAPVQLCG